jgi:hypothetical protein
MAWLLWAVIQAFNSSYVRTVISYVLKGRLAGQSSVRFTHNSLRASLSLYLGLGPLFGSIWLSLAIALSVG